MHANSITKFVVKKRYEPEQIDRFALLLQKAINDEKYGEILDLIKKHQNNSQFEVAIKDILTKNHYPKVHYEEGVFFNTKKMKLKAVFENIKQMGHKLNYRIKSKEIVVYNNNYVLSVNYFLYKQLLERIGKTYLIKLYKIEQRLMSQKTMKDLSVWALRSGDNVKDFSFLVGLETLWGYNVEPNLTADDIKSDINDWVTVKFIPRITNYNDKFRLKVKEVLNKGKVTDFTMTIKDFCENIPLTSTSGSGYDPDDPGSKVKVEYNQRKVSSANNKFSKSMNLTVKQKINKMMNKQSSKNKVSIKVELIPKVRYIIGSDYKTFLKMTFVEQWLSSVLSDIGFSTLWSSQADLYKMWEDTCAMDGVRVPIDQTGFDHNVSKEMVLIMLEEIKELVNTKCNGNKEELILIMDLLITSVATGIIIIPKTLTGLDYDIELPWENGVLSGWRWTALLDTLANVAEMLVAESDIKEQGIIGNIKLFNAQGDDQNNICTSWSYALAYWTNLTMNGFKIHITKNFFSDHHTEYLRRFSVKGKGINGYPARMINKMNFLYPGKQEFLPMVEKAASIVAKWKTLCQRFFRPDVMVTYIRDDLIGAKFPLAFIDTFLNTSKLRGGSEVTGKIETTRIDWLPGEFKYKFKLLDDPGLKQFKETFGEGQESDIDKWSINVLNVMVKPEHDPTFGVSRVTAIIPLPFVVGTGVSIERPKFVGPWKPQDIFANNDVVFKHAFGTWDIYKEKHGNVPKTWLMDFVTGNIKTVGPLVVDKMSDEFGSMFSKKYEGSAYSAMFGLRHKTDKWIGIQKFFKNEMERMISAQRFFMF